MEFAKADTSREGIEKRVGPYFPTYLVETRKDMLVNISCTRRYHFGGTEGIALYVEKTSPPPPQ